LNHDIGGGRSWALIKLRAWLWGVMTEKDCSEATEFADVLRRRVARLANILASVSWDMLDNVIKPVQISHFN
jgi:hypothetical protein